MNPEDLGTAGIEPKGSFPAGATGTWKITYIVGKYCIDDGGSIIITRRAMSDAVMPQCDNPTTPGYVTAETTGEAKLRVWYDNRYWIRPWRGAIVVRVFDGSLKNDDKIIVVIGDTSSGSPGWSLQTFPEKKHTFRVLVDSFGTREYYPVSEHPAITIVPGEPKAIEAVVPTTAQPGQKVPVWIRVLDEWGNPVRDFSAHVALRCMDNGLDINKIFTMHKGVEKSEDIQFPEEGIYKLSVSANGMESKSNPIVVSKNSHRILWGDMHGQTEGTVGTGTVEEYFRFARDSALIDVAGWQGNDFQITDAEWEEVCCRTGEFYKPGVFVTFLGYEWSGLTPAGGDHNIIFLEDNKPIYRSSHWQIHDGSSDKTDRYPISELWREFRGRMDVMAFAHVGGRYSNLDFWDDDFSGLVEIHSHHGTFEWFAKDALRRGLIVGFVGQSDDHTGRPGLSAPLRPLARDFATFDVYGGYTGIFADELTRQSVWDALKARHCYATTGCRIFLDIRSGKYMMGDVIEEEHPVDISVSVVGTSRLLDVEVLRNTDIIYRYPFCLDPDDTWVRIEWSGVRVKNRAKTADWDGMIRVINGIIDDFRPYAFDQRSQGIIRQSEHTLDVISTTSGDIDGVFLKVHGKSPVVIYENPDIRCEVPVDELEQNPRAFDLGGVNLQMRFSLFTPNGRSDNLRFRFHDKAPIKGLTAYWVKVVQIDGHMAWSSPLYFVNPESKEK